MKYTYTEAITPDGWGIYGVFPVKVAESAPRDEKSGRPIIDSEHLIVGQGPGWDSGATIDEDWLRRAVEALNSKSKEEDDRLANLPRPGSERDSATWNNPETD